MLFKQAESLTVVAVSITTIHAAGTVLGAACLTILDVTSTRIDQVLA